MKKLLALLLTLTLTLSMSLCAFAASDKSNNGKGNGSNKSENQTLSSSTSDVAAESTPDSLWYNKSGNLAKLYTEDGKKVMFPVHALLNHGATEVIWSDADGTVTVTGSNGMTVVFSPNSTTAATQASVTLGDTSGINPTVTPDVIDPTIATLSGEILATITDPLTGNPISVSLTISGSVSGYDSVAGTGTIGADATFSGDYTDAITGQVVTISGTITQPTPESLSGLDFTLNDDSTSIDFAIPFENEISNGRAYVPIQDLDKLFATELVTAAATEPIVETDVPTI